MTVPPRQPDADRAPAAFDLDDPKLSIDRPAPEPAPDDDTGIGTLAPSPGGVRLSPRNRGTRWGAIFASACGALLSLAATLWFLRFITIAVERNDWLGWIAFSLLTIAAVALVMLIGREAFGYLRLRRLGRLRADAERALATRDLALERETMRRIVEPLAARPDLSWSLARLREHAHDVHDPGDLFRLADRNVMLALDGEARRLVASAARRVGVVSAMSPTALLTVSWVMIENLRLLRRLAGLYGGRPGFIGTARLARTVFVHIVATGGVALTDDLIGQFLGQDLLRRLSRRLGESVFNAAMIARVGAAAIEVIRPLPYLEAPRIRARDFIGEITRRRSTTPEETTAPRT
jgi:putative membrane protein